MFTWLCHRKADMLLVAMDGYELDDSLIAQTEEKRYM